MSLKQLLLLALIAAFASAASANIADNFDSYANQSALNAVYTQKVASPIALDQTKGHSDGQSITAGVHTGSTHPASYRNLGAEYGGTDALPLSVKFWLDQSDAANTTARDWFEIRGFEGTGWGQGGTQEIIALGLGSNALPSSANYTGRVWSGPGYFNLTQARSTGWHEMEILIKSSTVEMYVDGALGATQSRTPGVTFDSIVFGSGLSSQVQVWFDDLQIANVPEPGALVLLAIGAALAMRRR